MMHRMRLIAVSCCLALCCYTGQCDSDTDLADICSVPQHYGVCYEMFSSWYYDPSTQECKEFFYGGCGGDKNRFKSEVECYQTCKEKLVQLHKPRNLTVAYKLERDIYIFWYEPVNFELHEPPSDNSTGTNETETQSSSSVPSTGGSGGLTHVTLHRTVSNSSVSPGYSVQTDGQGNSTDNTTVLPGTNSSGSPSTTERSNSSNQNQSSTSTTTTTTTTTTTPPTIETVVNASIADYIGKEKVPFHMAKMTHYVVSHRKVGDVAWVNTSVAGNKTDYKLSGLEPGTVYEICLGAVYITNTTMMTDTITTATRHQKTVAGKCYCDPKGTVGGVNTCNLTSTQLPWCQCQTGYTGLFCELCKSGYYRTGASLPCHRCPCTLFSSTGSCYFVEGYLHCTMCKEGYAGNLCHRCGNGYYRTHGMVECAECRNCLKAPGPICDPFHGNCLNCKYNATGAKCDVCLPGYIGDPIHGPPCVLPPSEKKTGFRPPSDGVIAAICVSIIVVLSAIVGFVVYRKTRNYRAHRPFWTVELKEGHDGVDFSSLPEDEGYAEDRNVEDLDFYGHSRANKSQPYARLQETI